MRSFITRMMIALLLVVGVLLMTLAADDGVSALAGGLGAGLVGYVLAHSLDRIERLEKVIERGRSQRSLP